ncbi:hypothetical protein Micbo1qcDRAFT_172008 [Microdochium bolleyi]|uniref:Uncharacterized protein n=1 Tax=Microdochium bolleyi TaxID=196109 RepID=A0A136JEU0_9PEZI|nr:hypothetical protein Micbo1qcDRAFT_172008 [Microdochium bolleyi]
MTRAASYAREQGLTVDYTEEPVAILGGLSEVLAWGLSSSKESSTLLDDSALPHVGIFQVECLDPACERLQISRAALDLLNQALVLGREPCPRVAIGNNRPAASLAAIKLEPPLLSSDHGYDVQQLARSCQTKRTPALTPDYLPLERLSASNDESLEFPTDTRALHEKLRSIVQGQKLDVSRDSIKWLAQTLSWDSAEMLVPMTDGRPHPGLTRRSITPPLMPLIEDTELFMPNAQACQVPLTSDPDTLIEEDLHNVEETIFKGDGWGQGSLDKTMASSALVSSPTSTELGLSTRHEWCRSIRMESPLPDRIEVSPPTASSGLKVLRSCATEILSRSETTHASHADAHESQLSEDVFGASCREVLEQLVLGLQQERLDAADATARIPIPTMDFSIQQPAWQHETKCSRNYFSSIQKELFNVMRPLTITRRARNDSQLRWMPFPSQEGQVDFNEVVEEPGVLATI